MALTKVRAGQVTGVQGFPKAFLYNLIPSSNRPNTTGDFILEGAFFTPTMTVVVEGQTINKVTFISDNKIVLNLTTGSTEGFFDITIDNGSGSITFQNTLFIVLGDVFEPSAGDWNNIVNNLDVSEKGTAKISALGVYSSGFWNKEFDYTKDFSFRFNLEPSPLGNPYPFSNTFQHDLRLVRTDNESPVITLESRNTSADTSTLIYAKPSNVGATIYENWDYGNPLLEDVTIEIRWQAGILYLYKDNAVLKSYSDVLTSNLKLWVHIRNFNIKNIKYIELA